MKLNLLVLVVIAGSVTSCGADVQDAGGETADSLTQEVVEFASDASPKFDNALLASEAIGFGEEFEIDEAAESIILAQAQSAEVTIGNEGEEPIEESQEPNEGNLFIDSKENEMDEETAKEAEASFEWVSPNPNSGDDLAEGAGFEWSDDGSEEALEKAEAERSAADAGADAEAKAREEASKQVELERLRSQEAISEAQRRADEELTAATNQMQSELQALKDEQARILAEIAASKKDAAEQAARDEKVRQAELDRLREEAEKEKMASEAARREVDEIAKEKAAAERELEQAQLEKERILADAEQARLRAESEAKAKAEVEAELLKAKEEGASEERARADRIANEPVVQNTSPKVAPEKPKVKVILPSGTLQLAKLEQGAFQDGVYGIQLGGEARIENLNGAKIELAAYFFDGEGEPLKDSDRVNRSSRGQVYVGKELVAESNAYTLKDGLFLPFKQLDLGSTESSDVQVELVLWEYSQGRGKRLAVAPRETFRYVPISSSERENIKRREDITGTWKQDEITITVDQRDGKVVVTGLDAVPNNIVSEEWGYADGKLLGSIVSQRKFPKRVRVWDFELQVSQDGKSLTGKYHRADKKGNFGFDSESFVWRRVP
jgi:hypothetical protein